MYIIDRNSSVVGSYYFDDPLLSRRIATDGNFADLYKAVVSMRKANEIETPGTLFQEIEDQICQRQPPGKCRMGAGDFIASGIQKIAKAVDRVAGTKLEEKARGCGGCKKRKITLNNFQQRAFSHR